jgi:hypothetical protein
MSKVCDLQADCQRENRFATLVMNSKKNVMDSLRTLSATANCLFSLEKHPDF